MAFYLETWIQGPRYEAVWLFEDNRHDPKPMYMDLRLNEQVILERHIQAFANTGRLNDPRKGHWRKGPVPYNKIFEFKALAVRLLAFTAPVNGSCSRLVLAAVAYKDGDDIREADVQRAVDRRQRFLAITSNDSAQSNTRTKLRRSS